MPGKPRQNGSATRREVLAFTVCVVIDPVAVRGVAYVERVAVQKKTI